MFAPAFGVETAVFPDTAIQISEIAAAPSAEAPLHDDVRHGGLRRGLGAVIAASILAAGCSNESSETPEPRPSVPTVQEQRTTDYCAPDNIPLTKEQILCTSRRTGTLLVVVAPGLAKTPDINLTNPAGDATKVARYAANALHTISGGSILLTPKVITAPKGTIEAIKAQSPKGCMGDGEYFMGNTVLKTMPRETADAAQVVVLGGTGCTQGTYETVGGVANYEPTKRIADVYAEVPGGGVDVYPPTPVTKTGGRVIHELLHNFGLGHAGTLTFKDYKAMYKLQDNAHKPVDLAALLGQRGITVDEYGDLGNAMSNAACNIRHKGECDNYLSNPAQEDYLRQADPDKDAGEKAPILTDAYDIKDTPAADEPRAVIVPTDISLGYLQFAGSDVVFSRLVVVPYSRSDGARGVEILLSTGASEELNLTTVSVGSFALGDTPRHFMMGSSQITVTRTGDATRIERVQ